jgi:hypothetical protein
MGAVIGRVRESRATGAMAALVHAPAVSSWHAGTVMSEALTVSPPAPINSVNYAWSAFIFSKGSSFCLAQGTTTRYRASTVFKFEYLSRFWGKIGKFRRNRGMQEK